MNDAFRELREAIDELGRAFIHSDALPILFVIWLGFVAWALVDWLF